MNPHMRVKVHITPFQSYFKLVVSRQACANSWIKYTINGRGSIYYEVQSLLKGPHRRGTDSRTLLSASSNTLHSSKLSKGGTAGISVGSVFGLFFILAVIAYFVRRRRTGRQLSSIIDHNQEKKEADIIQPFTYNPLPASDAPSPLLSTSHSNSQLGHETLRTQVSIGSLPTTPPMTGIWPATAGKVAGADPSDVASSRNSEVST